MNSAGRRLVYPEPIGLETLPIKVLPEALELIYSLGSALPYGLRVPLSFNSPGQFFINISSVIADEKGWIRAGVLAHIIATPSGDAKRTTRRAYIDNLALELSGKEFPYYLEFWPYRWISDYYFEIWAKRSPESRALEAE